MICSSLPSEHVVTTVSYFKDNSNKSGCMVFQSLLGLQIVIYMEGTAVKHWYSDRYTKQMLQVRNISEELQKATFKKDKIQKYSACRQKVNVFIFSSHY